MNFRRLSYFVQVVDSGSISAAARRLNIAQPPLSSQIKQLEDEVGWPASRARGARRPPDGGRAAFVRAGAGHFAAVGRNAARAGRLSKRRGGDASRRRRLLRGKRRLRPLGGGLSRTVSKRPLRDHREQHLFPSGRRAPPKDRACRRAHALSRGQPLQAPPSPSSRRSSSARKNFARVLMAKARRPRRFAACR